MTAKTNNTSKKEENYVKVVFESEEESTVRHQRLLKELDTKLANRLDELKRFAEETLKQNLVNKEANAIPNFNKRMDYLKGYAQETINLKNIILGYSNVNKTSEYLSKKFLKNHAGNEFLTEGGYPNEKFRIELLARVIKTINEPGDVENQKQLNLIHSILPDGTSRKVPLMLCILALAFFGLAIAGILLGAGPGAILPIALGLTMLPVGLIGGIITGAAAITIDANHDAYKTYKESIPSISQNLQFFSKDKMEQQVIPTKADAAVDENETGSPTPSSGK